LLEKHACGIAIDLGGITERSPFPPHTVRHLPRRMARNVGRKVQSTPVPDQSRNGGHSTLEPLESTPAFRSDLYEGGNSAPFVANAVASWKHEEIRNETAVTGGSHEPK